MAFDPLERLENGNVDFMFNDKINTPYFLEDLIKRIRNSPRRKEILAGCIVALVDYLPRFCFMIMADADEYSEYTSKILKNYYSVSKIKKEELELVFNNREVSKKYIHSNYNELAERFGENFGFVLDFMFKNISDYIDILDALAVSLDLSKRANFMKYLIRNYPNYISLFYDDLTKYFTSVTYRTGEQLSLFVDKMDVRDVSEIAYIVFESGIDYELWKSIKEYIFENYKYNELAYNLLKKIREDISKDCFRFVQNNNGISEFSKDADRLYDTLSRDKAMVTLDYSKYVSKELINRYKSYLELFMNKSQVLDFNYQRVCIGGLEKEIELLVEKYLDLSSVKTREFIEKGSTASAYRIGDYVIKLVNTKWSYEDVICPDLYLILKNLEEIYLRNKDGVVIAGIEVQRYLTRSASEVPEYVLKEYISELTRLGYYLNESLLGIHGENCRMLDNYLESGNCNPPEWFKKYPVVLVDRDRIYKLENKHPKQLAECYM